MNPYQQTDSSLSAPVGRGDGTVSPTVAYFSMEVGLKSDIPTYSGGLGVLAGDTLRSAADLGVRMAGVTLLYRKGYFRQSIGPDGQQGEHDADWIPEHSLERMDAWTSVQIEGRSVTIACWRYSIRGITGHVVPVYLLDTDISSNAEQDRGLTHHLYGGDDRYRLCQEAILGIGGQRILARLGHGEVEVYHMNEGHSSLLGLALLEGQVKARGDRRASPEEMAWVRDRCVFTTHTPVPAGHDRFHRALVERVLGESRTALLDSAGLLAGDMLNMTRLAFECSRFANGVARIHQSVSQEMFPRYRVRAVTNGIHAVTWAARPMRDLFDRHIPEWRTDSLYLRYATAIPVAEVLAAHSDAKQALVKEVHRRTGVQLSPEVLTIGFARRATPYKRGALVFHSLERLRWIAKRVGRFQLVYAGKAHPRDEGGKQMIRDVHEAARALGADVPVVYVENYEMELGRILTSGSDLWLNAPEKTREASGTSGMKAALNGVPSLSVLDGWWLEGHVEGVTGWSAANYRGALDDEASVAHALYDKLERVTIPLFYERPKAYGEVMRSAIALNGSFFNTRRMVLQYASHAYAARGTGASAD